MTERQQKNTKNDNKTITAISRFSASSNSMLVDVVDGVPVVCVAVDVLVDVVVLDEDPVEDMIFWVVDDVVEIVACELELLASGLFVVAIDVDDVATDVIDDDVTVVETVVAFDDVIVAEFVVVVVVFCCVGQAYWDVIAIV